MTAAAAPRVVTLKSAAPPDPPDELQSAPFPVECLPAPLRDRVMHAALSSSTCVSLCAANGLAVASASLGSGVCVQSSPERVTFPNLFILGFAQSGTGKGQAFGEMTEPYREEQHRRMVRWLEEERPELMAALEAAESDIQRGKSDRKKAKSDLQKRAAFADITAGQRAKAEAEQALAAEPILNIGQATQEAVASALAHSPGEAGAILSAEGRDVIDNLLGRYSKSGKGSDESIYLQKLCGNSRCLRSEAAGEHAEHGAPNPGFG